MVCYADVHAGSNMPMAKTVYQILPHFPDDVLASALPTLPTALLQYSPPFHISFSSLTPSSFSNPETRKRKQDNGGK